jgi:hypothetical protein
MIFFCGSVYFGQEVQKTMFIFFQSRSLAEPLATSRRTLGFRGTPLKKPCSSVMQPRSLQGLQSLMIIFLYILVGLLDYLTKLFELAVL